FTLLSYLRTPLTASAPRLCSASTSASSLIQTVLQVLHCDLQILLHPLKVRTGVLLLLQLFCHHCSLLLLDSQGIIPAPDFRVQGALHGFNDSLAVPLDLFHLLILLCKLPVNLSLDLV
ncbi:hypothetical protein PO909_025988, partial [Leuciscus waleckii]